MQRISRLALLEKLLGTLDPLPDFGSILHEVMCEVTYLRF